MSDSILLAELAPNKLLNVYRFFIILQNNRPDLNIFKTISSAENPVRKHI